MKTISFDVWNTLIIPNPEFARKRKFLISEFTGIDPEIVSESYTKVKRHVDHIAETTGLAFSTPIVYRKLLDQLDFSLIAEAKKILIDEVNDLFLKNPPIILDSVKEAINLAKRNGQIGIGSNSNFISGAVMNKFLEKELEVKFDFSVYSDLCGVAKPNKRFFEIISERSKTNPSLITHIGDNHICDGGAKVIGCNFKIITHPEKLFDTVKDIYHE